MLISRGRIADLAREHSFAGFKDYETADLSRLAAGGFDRVQAASQSG